MSVTYCVQGHARRGAAPGGAGSAGGAIGSVIYDRTPPDNTYLLASGGTVNASDYPEYALSLALPPIFATKLATPALVPAGDNYYPIWASGPNMFSDNGEWFATCEASATTGTAFYLYRIVNGVSTRMFTGNVSTSRMDSSGCFAVSNNGDIFTSAPYSNYVSIYRNNGDGTWSNIPISGTIGSQYLSLVTWSKDSQYLIYGSNAAPYIGALKMPASLASTTLTAAAVTVSPALAAIPTMMGRSLTGDRWALGIGNTTVNVYDFVQGTMTFTLANGGSAAQTIQGANRPISMNFDGTAFMVWNSGTGLVYCDVWSETTKGLGFQKTASIPVMATNASTAWLFGGNGDSYVMSTYSSDGNQLWVLNGNGTYKAFSGILPGQAMAFGSAISRDGSTLFYGYNGSNGNTSIQLYRLGQSGPPILPIPTLMPQGYGPAKLLPFVKVRS